MHILKKLLFYPALLLTMTAPFVYGGSTFMNGDIQKPWKFSLNACASFFVVNTNKSTNDYNADYLSMLDFGFRVGLPGNFDFGLKLFKLGIVTDIKYIFMEFYPFKMALDIEGCFASQVSIGFAIIMDLELNSYVAVYLSARWRYPSLYDVDPTYFSSGTYMPLGMMFLSRFGIELFRHNSLSFGIEGGIVTSWTSTALGFNAGALVTWHIN